MNYLLTFALVSLITLPSVVFAQSAPQPFVPLTSLPGLSELGNESNMTQFLNALYRICIGAAAAIAVLQIIRAGILFMTNKGSVSENEQAKELVRGAVLGLILVLSPVIVFGIINPKILTLDFGAENLKQEKPATGSLGSSETPAGQVTEQTIENIASYCSVQMTPEQKSCIDAKGKLLQQAYASCITNGTVPVETCRSTLVASGGQVPGECGLSVTSTQASCITNAISASAQAATPANAGAKYGWMSTFFQSPTCTSDSCPTITLRSKSPFSTEALCVADFEKGVASAPGPLKTSACICSKTIKEQGSACATLSNN